MSKSENELISRFEEELRLRATSKTGRSGTTEKVLTDAFRFYDLNNSGFVDLNVFKQVVLIKMSLTQFSESVIEHVYQVYSRATGRLNYKEFISDLFDNQGGRMSMTSKGESKPVKEGDEDPLSLKRLFEFVGYKLRKKGVSSFFKLYRDLCPSRRSPGVVNQSQLIVALRKFELNVGSDDIRKMIGSLTQSTANDFFSKLTDNSFPLFRDQLAQGLFRRLDFNNSGSISISLLKDLLSTRHSSLVKDGRFSAEELETEMSVFLDEFAKFNQEGVMEMESFMLMFSLLNIYFNNVGHTASFFEGCFKLTELPRTLTDLPANGTSQPNVIGSKSMLSGGVFTQSSKVDDLLQELSSQVRSRGNRGFISLYRTLRAH